MGIWIVEQETENKENEAIVGKRPTIASLIFKNNVFSIQLRVVWVKINCAKNKLYAYKTASKTEQTEKIITHGNYIIAFPKIALVIYLTHT
ncbi:MAG: hypothetical protein M0R51_18275 [Clostridia bacterium]|jgi:hypothetical protein|nr:hypothetical protein [Clostridia bacterium]